MVWRYVASRGVGWGGFSENGGRENRKYPANCLEAFGVLSKRMCSRTGATYIHSLDIYGVLYIRVRRCSDCIALLVGGGHAHGGIVVRRITERRHLNPTLPIALPTDFFCGK